MIKRDTNDAHTELARIGEIRQSLLTRRVLLTKDHLPLRAVQRLPQADASLQRAAQIVGEAHVPSLHLEQHVIGRNPGDARSIGTICRRADASV